MRAKAGVILVTAMLALMGCDGPAPPSPSASPSRSAELPPTNAPTGQPTTAAPPSGLPADLVSYIMAGSKVSLEPYIDEGYALNIASFSTPSGNISCGLASFTDPWVMCQIGENSWPSIPTPTCEYGTLWLPSSVKADIRGVSRSSCLAGEHFSMPGKVLPYGSTITAASIACHSESAFLACAVLTNGNGFAIARAIYYPYGPVAG